MPSIALRCHNLALRLTVRFCDFLIWTHASITFTIAALTFSNGVEITKVLKDIVVLVCKWCARLQDWMRQCVNRVATAELPDQIVLREIESTALLAAEKEADAMADVIATKV